MKIYQRNVVLVFDNARPHLEKKKLHRGKKYFISTGLFYRIHHIHQTLHQEISTFYYSIKNTLQSIKTNQTKSYIFNIYIYKQDLVLNNPQ